eukprot:TRINITY_DN59525_c0_g1_i1.p1 TRINITY_DN59525_c0_g1~~TRINITY_DN59525_c0_g1_i1.p1  ORF type:complete len:621 (+),score=88.54 TRINITY_DN59525_c0_g1_i1:90-1952(+)
MEPAFTSPGARPQSSLIKRAGWVAGPPLQARTVDSTASQSSGSLFTALAVAIPGAAASQIRRRSSTTAAEKTRQHRLVAVGRQASSATAGSTEDEDVDVVVIGSGIGGLCAGALLAYYGQRVVVCEAHGSAGGAAHGFTAKVPKAKGGGEFYFDTGPSFFSGLSLDDGARINPLKAVLDILDVKVPCHQYTSFGLLLPEGDFVHTPAFGDDVLGAVSGGSAKKEWADLLEAMKPLAAMVEALPVAALRTDPGVVVSAAPFMPKFLQVPGGPFGPASQLNEPFSTTLDAAGVKDTFARRWLDLLCFCLSGLPTTGTVTAEMAMMFGEFYKQDAVMDYPVGGVKCLVQALVEGLEKYGGEVRLRSCVEQVLVEDGKAAGVRLSSGKRLRAKSVICGASVWDMLKLLPTDAVPRDWSSERSDIPPGKSFMHLHIGFDASGLDLAKLQAHYICLRDWASGVEAEENAVLISIPSVEDDTVAPAGCAVLHAYTPATEPWERWQHIKRGSEEYEALKEERAEYLWSQVERVIPDIRSRAKVEFVGTPLTHQRFLRKHQGTYGPAIKAGQASFPGPTTPLPGLIVCGDSCFPGIGVPAVAASGLLAAHATGLDTLGKQVEMIKRVFK